MHAPLTTSTDDDGSAETPEQARFRAEVQAFLAANARPKPETSPWALNFHTDPRDARREFEAGRAWQRTRFDADMAGFTYPRELGGRGGEPWQERIYEDEAAGYDATSGFIRATIAMLGPTLMTYGTEQQQRELIPRLLSGEDAWCQLFSEPGAGSDLAGLGCRARRDGDEFVVTGQKVWNSAAQFCDRGMLLVRTSPDVPKHRGITFLLVDMASPGIEVRPLVQATGAAEFNEVFLDSVRVPVSQVLGEIDGGWAPARTVMSNESAMIGGGGGGTYAKLLLLARRFGCSDDPVARQRLAHYYTRERLLNLMGERILTAVRRREQPPVDPSILKLFVAANRVLSGNVAASLAGPSALQTDDEVGRWIAAEVAARYMVSIGGGTNEVQRNNLAERALGLPRDPHSDRDQPWSATARS